MFTKAYKGLTPKIDGGYVAEDVSLIGDVEIGENASIWYGAVLRGDHGKIVIGANTSVQDNTVAHCSLGNPTIIGKNCVVGHNAILHSCVVEDGCLIGMGSILLDNCHIGAGSVIAAGAVVSPRTVIPPCSMVMGVPGRVVRQLGPENAEDVAKNVESYISCAGEQLPKYHL